MLPDQQRSMVYIVDDDQSIREALSNLFDAVGIDVRTFSSAEEFLASQRPSVASCLVLDVRLPGVSGLHFQDELARANVEIPIIFISAHADVPMSVRAMKAGAIEFLPKPFRDQELLDAVQQALLQDSKRLVTDGSVRQTRENYEKLTARERAVMRHVVNGLMNKQIAAELGLAEITVKIHRGSLNRKMGARSVADLVRMSQAVPEVNGH